MTAWEKCVAYHGHICGGIALGYRAVLYAMDLLDLEEGAKEEVRCVAGVNNCSVDAFRVLLGCTEERGNLAMENTGKPQFSLYNSVTGESIRLIMRPLPQGIPKEHLNRYIQNANEEDLFDTEPADPADFVRLMKA